MPRNPGQATVPEPHKRAKTQGTAGRISDTEVIYSVFFLPYLILLKPYFSK